ncbi:MAG: tRNA-dihydrouridine synthase, partial [Pseudomonadota bacterium]
DRQDLEIVLNGGIRTLDDAKLHLEWADGVMIGRAAYADPAGLLGHADALITGQDLRPVDAETAVRAMYPYIENALGRGVRLHQITRHMLGAFNGRPGARRWRRTLSELAHRDGAGLEVLDTALAEILPPAQAAE